MSKTLIVAEKPSVAKDIALALGGFGRSQNWLERDDTIVTAAQGHLAEVYAPEMASSGKTLETLPVIPAKFEVRVLPESNKREAYKTISQLMARGDVDTIVNACDSGREGELIFRLIYDLAGCKKPVMRLWCQSMTPEGIRDSYRNMNPASHYDFLGDAAYARTEGDYLVGINGSRGVTRLYERQTSKAESRSVGRVQTPTGAIVYDREMAIRAFKPQDFWEIHGHFGVAAGDYVGKWFDPNTTKPSPSATEQDKAEADA
jgi:DNA topoisomerase-3